MWCSKVMWEFTRRSPLNSRKYPCCVVWQQNSSGSLHVPACSEVFTHSAWPDIGEFGPRRLSCTDCTNSVLEYFVSRESVDSLIHQILEIKYYWVRIMRHVSFHDNLTIFTGNDSSGKLMIFTNSDCSPHQRNILGILWSSLGPSKTNPRITEMIKR